MKIKKGMFRIYIIASIIWSAYFFMLLDAPFADKSLLWWAVILPLPLYFVLKWILKGFE